MWRYAVSAIVHRYQTCICSRRFRVILMAVSGNKCWKGCWVCHLLPYRAPCRNEEKSARRCFKADVIPLVARKWLSPINSGPRRIWYSIFYVFVCNFLPVSSTAVQKNSIVSLEPTSKEKVFTTRLWTALHGWWSTFKRISVKEINLLIEQNYCAPKLHVWEVSTVFK